MKKVITISGGLTSAYVAKLVLAEDENAELVFTDTGWESKDLFRFLKELETLFNKKITMLSSSYKIKFTLMNARPFRITHESYAINDNHQKGYYAMNPASLFIAQNILGNNRMPICSRKLKVETLQKYLKQKYDNQCIVYFGIDYSEKHRAERIKFQYDKLGIETRFPMVENKMFFMRDTITTWLNENNIEIPLAYKRGDSHNNCSGGCVRAGKKSWLHLLKTNGTVYAERERLENSFKEGNYTYMKDLSLKELRENEANHCNLFEVDETPCMCFEV